ncbi:DUF402 domain-containing protein [Candidatus Poribacteria bacterium]|nr:DUF402 domain-containing protein [Candidatus Poribacteria bacterium]
MSRDERRKGKGEAERNQEEEEKGWSRRKANKEKMRRKVTEEKRHLNKPTEYYECELLDSQPGHAVLRYVSDRTFASTRLGVTFPPGCVTIALYWEERPYVFWGVFSPAGGILGYLVHICEKVNIGKESVSYLDMLLDLWFYPDGRHVILDADEVEECLASGLLTTDDKAYIEKAKENAVKDFALNVEELKAFSAHLRQEAL